MLQKIKNRLKEQKGFTLIELLAVIVILGIIAAIAVPSIMNVINNSREDAVKADAIQILNAAKLYIAENGSSSDIKLTYNDLKDYMEVEDLAVTTTVANDIIVTVDNNVGTSEGQLQLNATLKKGDKSILFTDATVGDINSDNATAVSPQG